MEKYFIVSDKSSLHDHYFKWKQNTHDVNERIKEFFVKHEIEANIYAAYRNALYIRPTAIDKERFSKMFCKEEKNEICQFKKNSSIGKAYASFINENKIEILRKPMAGFYFGTIGRSSSRLFDQDGILYCSIESEVIGAPEGTTEIKASEFYKALESEGV